MRRWFAAYAIAEARGVRGGGDGRAADAMTDEWLVVETQYPTEYGCYRGRRWSRLDLIQRSDVTVHGPFLTRAEAIDEARERASSECRFEGEDLDALGDPPWDSADLENWDNDEEVRFEVMRRTEHDAHEADDRAHATRECGKLRFEAMVRQQLLTAQVRSAGRVYYGCRPNDEVDIAADLEVVEKRTDGRSGSYVELKGGSTEVGMAVDAGDDESPAASEAFAKGSYVVVHGLVSAAKYNGRVGYVRGALSDNGRHAVVLCATKDAKAAGIEARASNLTLASVPAPPPPGVETAKTLRFDASDEELRRAPPRPVGTPAPPEPATERPPPEDALAALCRQMPALAEIHYFGDRSLTEARVLAVLGAAPHLARTLKHFRCAKADMSPEAVAAMAGFRALERLDITNCISTGYCDTGFDYDSDDPYGEKARPLTYDEPLEVVLKATPHLTQLDFGYGDDEMTRYFWDYCLSDAAMQRFQCEYPRITFTMSAERDPLPFPFAGGDAEQERAVEDAILHLAEDSDEGVRANAAAALAGEDEPQSPGMKRARQ